MLNLSLVQPARTVRACCVVVARARTPGARGAAILRATLHGIVCEIVRGDVPPDVGSHSIRHRDDQWESGGAV